MPPLHLTLRTALHQSPGLLWLCALWGVLDPSSQDWGTALHPCTALHLSPMLHDCAVWDSALHWLCGLSCLSVCSTRIVPSCCTSVLQLRCHLCLCGSLLCCVTLLDDDVVLGLWTLLGLCMVPGNAPPHCANRWRATTTLHLHHMASLYCTALL